mgnify:CR=1 FL=1
MLARSPRNSLKVGAAVLVERAPGGRSFVLIDRRLAEMALLLRHRHGATVPHTDDADTWATPLADTLAAAARLAGREAEPTARVIAERLVIWCPEMSTDEAAGIAAAAIATARRWSAADLGDALNLQPEERDRLGIRTIRPAGHRGRKWKDAQRAKDRQRAADRRAAAGAKNRAETKAALEAEIAASGLSRRTFFRRRAQQTQRGGTGTSAIGSPNSPDVRVPSLLHEPETAAAEARRLGVHRSTVIRRRRREAAAPDTMPTGPPGARGRARPAPPNTGCPP